MSGRFVRASKYRHVYGQPTKKDQCYDNLRVSKNAWDTNLVKVNPKYLSVNWEASGGGAFAVVPLDQRGKLPDQIPLFRGHTAAVLDTDWSPFDDSLIASSSDDGKVCLWKIPDDFTVHQDTENIEDIKPLSKLSGHSRKVGHILFNPSAADVLASSSGDYTIKIWDVEDGQSKLTLKHSDVVQSLSWSANGSLLVTTCRDKKLRVWDVRQEKPATEVSGHTGAKNSRAVWMGEHDRIATTGFSKMSDRQLGLWDIRAAREPLNGFEMLDQISGVCIPFWDEGTQCLYLAGRGDGNIRYYEYQHDKFEYLSQYSSSDPQRGIAFLPKRGVNLKDNEVTRAYKTVNDSYIEPIAFIVPRRAEVFQEDIYPPTVGLKPAMSSSEWLSGKEGMPPKISLESLFDGEGPVEVPANYKPPHSRVVSSSETHTPPPTKTEAESPKPAAAPVHQEPVGSVNDNKASMATMASKFADKSDDEKSESSSFEEVQKPIERPSTTTAATTTAASTAAGAAAGAIAAKSLEESPSPTKTTDTSPLEPQPLPRVQQPSVSAEDTPTNTSTTASRAVHRSTSSTSSDAGSSPAANLRSHLQEIKSMLETQGKLIATQNEQIAQLTREMETLKTRNGAAS